MRDYSEILPIELCRKLYRYDPETGTLYRLYSNQDTLARPSGTRRKDYTYVVYQERRILAHRLAWALHYGEWPSSSIDHINCDRHDNRIANLRLATVAENNRNRPKQSNNTTGYKGVSFHKGTNRFEAKIMADKKRYRLGYFDTAEAAFAAYCEAAQRLHGEHARVSMGEAR